MLNTTYHLPPGDGNGDDAEFELFLGTSGAKKITFNGIITSMDTGTALGELTSVSCGFQASMSDPSTAATGIVIGAECQKDLIRANSVN